MRLLTAGREVRLLRDPTPLNRRRATPMLASEHLDELLLGRVALSSALRELADQRVLDPVELDLDLAAARLGPSPPDPEFGGEEVLEHAVVDLRQGHDLLVEAAAVKRAPLPVRARPGAVPDDHMVVQLRVAGAAVVVRERRRNHPLDVLLKHAVGA